MGNAMDTVAFDTSRAPSDRAALLAEIIQDWMADQSFSGESLLHAGVCCDFVGRARFIACIARIIDAKLTQPASEPEPITEEALRRMGWVKPPSNMRCPFLFSPWSSSDDLIRLSYHIDTGVIDMDVDDGYSLPHIKTIDQLQNLLSGLGIEPGTTAGGKAK